MARVRKLHWEFSHLWLPRLALSDARRFAATLGAPNGLEALRHLWMGLAQEQPEAERLPPEGLALHVRELGPGWRAFLVELPPPVAMTEAHFLAALVREEAPGGPSARVFSLELSHEEGSEAPVTVLAELTQEGRTPYGPGPAPTLEALLARLKELGRDA